MKKEERKVIKFVTGNEYKFREARDVMESYRVELSWIPLPIEEIQSNSLEEVVISKVLSAVRIVKPPFIVEDTGLFIEALNGFPGPFASYAFEKLGLDNILKLMYGIENRKAVFIAIGALVFEENIFKIFRGEISGEIFHEKLGDQGFGYDPIFKPYGQKNTLAQLSVNEKNKISHRGKLFREIGEYIIKTFSF